MKALTHKELVEKAKAEAAALHKIVVSTELSYKDKQLLVGRHQKVVNALANLVEASVCDCETTEDAEAVTRAEALAIIGDGHSTYEPGYMKRICEALGAPWDAKLQHHDFSDWTDFKGLRCDPGHEGALAVYALSLSNHVVNYYKLSVRQCRGRGFQARANSEAVAAHLKAGEDAAS